jgi:L-malate glycosyltransferase
MQSLDLFILPSKPVHQSDHIWEEQFGHVLIEAMACGVPTIGSDSGAIPEVVGEELGIFRHGKADAIYEKLSALLEAPEALAAMGARQRERVMQFYSHQAQISSRKCKILRCSTTKEAKEIPAGTLFLASNS